MRLLLDTHVMLWAIAAPHRLSEEERGAIADRTNAVYVSVASGWEISTKYALGKLPLPLPPGDLIPHYVERSGFETLPVHLSHAMSIAHLPHHHNDPFDRMLIAQATIENLTIVTRDHAFSAYSVSLWPATAP